MRFCEIKIHVSFVLSASSVRTGVQDGFIKQLTDRFCQFVLNFRLKIQMPLMADLNIRKNITFVALPILYPQVDPLNLRLGLGGGGSCRKGSAFET